MTCVLLSLRILITQNLYEFKMCGQIYQKLSICLDIPLFPDTFRVLFWEDKGDKLIYMQNKNKFMMGK